MCFYVTPCANSVRRRRRVFSVWGSIRGPAVMGGPRGLCCFFVVYFRKTIGKWWLNGISWGFTLWFHQPHGWLENPLFLWRHQWKIIHTRGPVPIASHVWWHGIGQAQGDGINNGCINGYGIFHSPSLDFIHVNTESGIYQTRILFQTKDIGDTMGDRLWGMPPWDAMLDWPSLGCGTPQLETNSHTIKYDTVT